MFCPMCSSSYMVDRESHENDTGYHDEWLECPKCGFSVNDINDVESLFEEEP